MVDIELTLGDGAMMTGRGVSAAADIPGNVVAGVTVVDGCVVGSGIGVGGANTGGGDGGRGSTEGARVNTGSVGVVIDVAKISEMCWIACKCSLPRVEKGVAGERMVIVTLRAQATAIAWLAKEACETGHWWEKIAPSWKFFWNRFWVCIHGSNNSVCRHIQCTSH